MIYFWVKTALRRTRVVNANDPMAETDSIRSLITVRRTKSF